MDDLARISVDEQTETQRREARKFVTSIAGDVTAYHAALKDAGISGDLLEMLTGDFGGKWHTYQLIDNDVNVSVMYADMEGDE